MDVIDADRHRLAHHTAEDDEVLVVSIRAVSDVSLAVVLELTDGTSVLRNAVKDFLLEFVAKLLYQIQRIVFVIVIGSAGDLNPIAGLVCERHSSFAVITYNMQCRRQILIRIEFIIRADTFARHSDRNGKQQAFVFDISDDVLIFKDIFNLLQFFTRKRSADNIFAAA